MENKIETTAAQAVNNKLSIVFERQYRKQATEKQRAAGLPGSEVFVYKVKGTPEQVAEYIKSKGEFGPKLTDKDGVTRFFSIRYVGENCDLMKTGNGEFRPDTSEIDKLANLTKQYGIDVAKEMMRKS